MRRLSRLPVALLACAAACAHPRQIHPQSQVPSVAAPAPAAGSARQGQLPNVAAHPAAPETARAAQVPNLAAPPPPAGAPAGVDFGTQVRPILEARCRPCHFTGGQMYDRLPFDSAATIVALREKLFTRIKDEHDRRTIRDFLAQHPANATGALHRPDRS